MKFKEGDKVVVIKPALAHKIGDIGTVMRIGNDGNGTILVQTKTHLNCISKYGWNFYEEELCHLTKLHKAMYEV